MQFLDPDDPFFRPLWRRIATVLLPGVWAGVELAGGQFVWAALFAATAGFALWKLILRRPG